MIREQPSWEPAYNSPDGLTDPNAVWKSLNARELVQGSLTCRHILLRPKDDRGVAVGVHTRILGREPEEAVTVNATMARSSSALRMFMRTIFLEGDTGRSETVIGMAAM
jgi:hypothetical protein